jgi:hypothetical protein
VIEVKVSVAGPGKDDYIRISRRGDDDADPAVLVAQALGQLAEHVKSPKLMEIAEAAYRITREERS